MSGHYPCHVRECPNNYHQTPGCRTLREREKRVESFGREKEAVRQSSSRSIRSDVRRQLRFAGADPTRLERAMKHRLYLVERMSPFDFHILGDTGSDYLVSLTSHPECTCPDHKNRRELCKHILFVLVRVLGLPEETVLREIAHETIIDACSENMAGAGGMERDTGGRSRVGEGALGEGNDEDGDMLRIDEHEALAALNTSAIQAPLPRSIHAKTAAHVSPKPIEPEDECPICCNAMLRAPLVFCANGCGKHLHEACIQTLLAFNKNAERATKCPLCRASWRPGHPQR